MGYFTWTDAKIKNPRKTKYGYAKSDMVNYDSYAKIVCPNDTEIETDCYDGYGHFGTKDAYDVVAEWNKPHLNDIIIKMKERAKKNNTTIWDLHDMEPLSLKYADSKTDDEVTAFVVSEINSGNLAPYLETEWKRTIGIFIACGKENNEALPYPLKITKNKTHIPYSDLYPSITCQ